MSSTRTEFEDQNALGPADLRAFMDQAEIEGTIIDLPVGTPTVAAAADALGVSQGTIVKSLLFVIEPDQAVLAIAPGPHRVSTSAIADWLGTDRKRIRLARPEEARQITGYEVGAVPPFGHRRELPVCMDRALLEVAEVHAGGGGLNSLLRIDPAEVARVTGAEFLELTHLGER